jgi:Flp pilus assembly protein TadD
LSIIYIYQNKYDLASGHARAVLQLDPGNIHAHLVNGISLYLQNYFIESKYEFDVVRFLEEKNQISIIMQVLIGLAMGDVEQSNILIAMIDNSHIEKTFLQLKIFRTMDRKYVNDLEKFLDADTEGSANHLAFILLAHFYKERQDTARARYYLLKAKDANEGIVIPYYSLAELEASQGNRAVAIAYLQQAIARQPSFVKAYIALGSLYEQVKEYQKAKTAYETGLRYAPDDNVLLNNLAWVNLVHLGDKSAAYIGVRNALSLTPEDPDIQDTLAWWYYLNDEHHYALALLKKIVATSPANPLYRYHLGMVYLKLGEQQAARLHFHKAMELGIADEHRHVIAELLK